MRRVWELLTARGRTLLVLGLGVVAVSMLAGQRDIMRVGLLLVALPVVAGVLVSRARLRISCQRVVDPAQVPLGSPMTGRITLGQDGRLPAGILLLEDQVPPEIGDPPRFLVDRADLSWRRQIEYPLLGRVRGRFRTGPLLVRTTDPFGLVQLDRQFVATSEVLVTPQIVPLRSLRSAGSGGSAGEAQPHRIGVVGADDVLVREYRQGDDVRRIHWRSTARAGQVMVRREEQSWDPSASLILDSRTDAHVGQGLNSSLEWAISAAASIAVHFLDASFSVEIFSAEGPQHIRGTMGQHSSASKEMVVSRLTDLRPRQLRTLHYAVEAAAAERAGQLVIAVTGRLSPADASALLRARRHRAQGMALVLDVDTWATGARRPPDETEVALQILRENSWRVVRVTAGMSVDAAWAALEQVRVAA